MASGGAHRRKQRFRLRRRPAQFAVGLCAVSVIALLQLFAAEPSRAERAPAARGEYIAIDGDTIERRSTGERIRLANIDTPETADRAQCGAERQRGELAKQRVREILGATGAVRVESIGRSDAYGRTIAYVTVDRRDLGADLIDENLARPWRGRREPWCGPDGRLLL
jgi:micrococcal nuclease